MLSACPADSMRHTAQHQPGSNLGFPLHMPCTSPHHLHAWLDPPPPSPLPRNTPAYIAASSARACTTWHIASASVAHQFYALQAVRHTPAPPTPPKLMPLRRRFQSVFSVTIISLLASPKDDHGPVCSGAAADKRSCCQGQRHQQPCTQCILAAARGCELDNMTASRPSSTHWQPCLVQTCQPPSSSSTGTGTCRAQQPSPSRQRRTS